ncbi:hypothetical protein CASFOL_034652 [Castilleja foliolosa]|uniref:Uncharacterized protein n=1 Tax=Castilleja foliolosa TaxID=1961234 RepID=A0ABD3BQH8_9LAMI
MAYPILLCLLLVLLLLQNYAVEILSEDQSSRASCENHLFLQWLEVNGSQLRGCKIKSCTSSKGFGIFSSKDVPDGVLLVVPLDLSINPMRVLEDLLIGHECRSMFEEGEVDDRFLIMLFLTVERIRKNSSWKPYLDMLPID